MRSLPCGIARWSIFSAMSARGVEHLLRRCAAMPENMRKIRDVADVRLGVRLEHERGERRVVVRVDLDRLVALGAVERVQLLHLVRDGHQLDDLREQRLRAVVEVGRDAEEREELLRFIASFIALIASSRAISPPSR